MKKFEKFKDIVESNAINKLSGKELAFITGGTEEGSGSQTSGTANNPTPCDNTCVCTCIPPIKKKKTTLEPGG